MCGKKEKGGILGDKSAKKLPEGFADEKHSRKLLTFEIVSESSVNFVYMDQNISGIERLKYDSRRV